MFCEEIRIKQGISYISFCPLRILYNSKFILMATSLVTNAVVVTRVHCTCSCVQNFVDEWQGVQTTDQMMHSMASDLGLHSLLRPICLNTWGKYDTCCIC